MTKTDLRAKCTSRDTKVGVIGLGYVGLALAVEFAKAGFEVTGIDNDPARIELISRGKSPIGDVSDNDIANFIDTRRLQVSDDYGSIADLDAVSICVPTPLRKTKDPDMSYIVDAAEQIKRFLKPGQLIILESTTYPGTTDELVQPILEKSGLAAGTDFFLAFSPERVDPGNQRYTTRNIPKVIGGITALCTENATALYEQVMDRVVPVSSTKVAETVKLLENTFRSVNIGLVNEMALMCRKLDVNVWEVIDAASTKPFGFMPFYPGPGLGGHCIPVDPFYLSWKAKMSGFESRFIELAAQVNNAMPQFVVERISDSLNGTSKSVNGARIHILGVAYKKDMNDIREAPSLDIMNMLTSKGAAVTYSDPYVPEIKLDGMEIEASELSADVVREADCTVVVTDHSDFDYDMAVQHSRILIDTRNALRDYRDDCIVRL